jgi:hypothetical protein
VNTFSNLVGTAFVARGVAEAPAPAFAHDAS